MRSLVQIVYRSAVTAALATLMVATGCGKKANSNILARVGEQTITVDDLKAEVQRRIGNRQRVPDRQKLLEEMIARTVLVQRARLAGLENAADVRRTVEDVLIAKLKEIELEPKLAAVTVSDEEARATYEKEIARFTQPEKAHLAIIYLAANSKTETNRLAEITARVNEIRRLSLALPVSVQGFGTLAAEFSDHQVSRYRGGDAGWYTAEQLPDHWPKEVVAAGMALKNLGEISDVIRAKDGFYLVKKMDARPPVITPFEQVKTGIQRRLLTAKQTRAEDEFRQSVRAAAKVQTDLELLSQVDDPTQSVAHAGSVLPSLPGSP